MIEVVCSFCLCLQIAMQNNAGQCHKCVTDVSVDEAIKVVRSLNEPEEFMALNCRSKHIEAKIDFNKQGPVFNKKK